MGFKKKFYEIYTISFLLALCLIHDFEHFLIVKASLYTRFNIWFIYGLYHCNSGYSDIRLAGRSIFWLKEKKTQSMSKLKLNKILWNRRFRLIIYGLHFAFGYILFLIFPFTSNFRYLRSLKLIFAKIQRCFFHHFNKQKSWTEYNLLCNNRLTKNVLIER